MIGPAIRNILLGSADVVALVGQNISPIRFTQAVPLPAIMYATDNIQPSQACRDSAGLYEGTLEISLLHERYLGIGEMIQAIRSVLDNYSGVSGEWSFRIRPGIEGPDDYDNVIKAYYKRLDFTITAEKAS
jgi:hypothetical protein